MKLHALTLFVLLATSFYGTAYADPAPTVSASKLSVTPGEAVHLRISFTAPQAMAYNEWGNIHLYVVCDHKRVADFAGRFNRMPMGGQIVQEGDFIPSAGSFLGLCNVQASVWSREIYFSGGQANVFSVVAAPTVTKPIVATLNGWQSATPLKIDPRAQNTGNAWNLTSTSDTLRYELRNGDSLPGESDRNRSEIYDHANSLIAGATYQISYKIMIEPGAPNAASWLVLNQIQSSFDTGEAGHSPPFSIGLANEKLDISIRYSTPRISTDANTTFVRLYRGSDDMVRGKWYDIKVAIRFDPFGNGMVKVWKDNVQIVNYAGAVGFNDVRGGYLKEGIYRAATAETLAVQYKGTSLGVVK